MSLLQEVQLVGQLHRWVLVNALAHQESQLVGILTWSRHADGSRPVVVEMAQLVGEPLHVVRLEPSLVVDDVVVGCSGWGPLWQRTES